MTDAQIFALKAMWIAKKEWPALVRAILTVGNLEDYHLPPPPPREPPP